MDGFFVLLERADLRQVCELVLKADAGGRKRKEYDLWQYSGRDSEC